MEEAEDICRSGSLLLAEQPTTVTAPGPRRGSSWPLSLSEEQLKKENIKAPGGLKGKGSHSACVFYHKSLIHLRVKPV